MCSSTKPFWVNTLFTSVVWSPSPPASSYHTQSARGLLLKVPRTFTVLGKTTFSFCAPDAWNNLQSMLHLDMLVPLNEFTILIGDSVTEECKCFFLKVVVLLYVLIM